MKLAARVLVLFFFVIVNTLFGIEDCFGKPSAGQPAPAFSLADLKGNTHDLGRMEKQPMLILYFFDIDSKSSQEGLLSLDRLAGQYKGAQLIVWAISLSPREKIASFAADSGIGFPLLPDKAGVSDKYGAQAVLPTVCIVGPGNKVLDFFQGGGKSSEMMMARVAERELQRKETQLAMAISREVVKKNPQNVEAIAVQGHAALNGGEVDKAARVFEDMSQKGGQAEVLGKEGLAAVAARKGDPDKAVRLASEVEKKAPNRPAPHVIKGDVLYALNKTAEAEAEYRKAVKKDQAAPYQKAKGFNQLGRLYAKKGDNEAARKLYDQAVAVDPYYIEGTTNKGMTYEREGKWDKAAESYKQALSVESKDPYAGVLARKAQEMLDLQKDAQRSQRVDRLVKELAERYRTQKKSASKDEDTWTSRPMILSFVDFQEKGGLAERDGLATVLTLQVTEQLNASNRVKVVERVLMDKLLEELNIGSSQLADQETALKLGKVLAAKLIGTGSLTVLPGSTLLTLKLMDSETSAISMVVNKDMGAPASVDKEASYLNREILKSVISKYPLRGFVVKPAADRVMINLGSKQGVVSGTKFDVLQEQEAISYKGKTLHSAPKAFAQVEVVQVEPELCYARVLRKDRELKTDDKVQEKLETTVPGGKDGV